MKSVIIRNTRCHYLQLLCHHVHTLTELLFETKIIFEFDTILKFWDKRGKKDCAADVLSQRNDSKKILAINYAITKLYNFDSIKLCRGSVDYFHQRYSRDASVHQSAPESACRLRYASHVHSLKK